MEKKYGVLPKIVGNYPIKVTESMFWLYLPIKMPHSGGYRIPEQLNQFKPLIDASVSNPNVIDFEKFDESYIYLTAKHMLVNPSFWGNRGGAHCDGFLTNDTNFVWYDKNPTLFNRGEFAITPDHTASLKEFEDQWDYKNEITFPDYSLLELNPYVVHKVAPVTRYDMRTFVKISVSTEKYNLIGNSHNYLFDYNWEMFDRQEVRNSPIYEDLKNSDYIPADVA